MYKIFETPNGKYILRTNDDGSFSTIPMDTNNIDYLNYLDWVNAGNVSETIEQN